MKREMLQKALYCQCMSCCYIIMAVLIVFPPSYSGNPVPDVSVNGMFDCRRDNTMCSGHGSCGLRSGDCTCNPEFTNIDCGLAKADIRTSCTSECANNGQCYSQGQSGNESCSCALGYFGEDCRAKRADLTCDGSKLILYLTPLTAPARVYVPGYREDGRCNAISIYSHGRTFYIELSLTTGCGAGTTLTTLNDAPDIGDITFRNWLVVQYNEGIISPLDNIYTLRCVLKKTAIFNATVEMTVNSVDKRKHGSRFLVQNQYDGAIFQILNSERKVIDGPVYSGSPLTLRVLLQTTQVYSAVRFERCVASERYDGTGRTIVLIKNGCVVWHPPASHMIYLDPITPGPQQTLPVGAIRFGNAPVVYISCSIVMCKERVHCSLKGLCAPRHSFRGGIMMNRGKRSLNSTDKEVVLTVKINVIDEPPIPKKDQTDVVSPKASTDDVAIQGDWLPPFQSTWFYLLGSVLVAVTVSTIFIVITVRKMRGRKNKKILSMETRGFTFSQIKSRV